MILVLRPLTLGKTLPRLPGVAGLLATSTILGCELPEALLVGRC